MALDSGVDFLSIEQEGARAGTDACGCIEMVPVATYVFIIVSIFLSEIGSKDISQE